MSVSKNIVIDNIVDIKNEELEEKYFLKYNHLYKIAIDVIKKYYDNVILYGGYAINELLPSELKFYRDDRLKDIDVFCNIKYYKTIEKDLLSTYEKQGYNYTTIREALHKNTYKLVVNGVQIMDISVLEPIEFETIKYGGKKTSIGLYTSNIHFLKYTLHLLLSKPDDSWRWKKIYPRMKNLYAVFPPTKHATYDCNDFIIDKIPVSITKKLRDFLTNNKNKVLSFGWNVIDIYLREGGNDILNINKKTPIQYLSTTKDTLLLAKNLLSHFNDDNIAISDTVPANIFTEEHTIMTYKNEKWIYIFGTSACYSYVTYKSLRIMSIHSIIANIYALYLSNNDVRLLHIVNVLIETLLNNKTNKSVFTEFIMNCQGNSKGIITLRKERFVRDNNK